MKIYHRLLALLAVLVEVALCCEETQLCFAVVGGLGLAWKISDLVCDWIFQDDDDDDDDPDWLMPA